MFTDPTITMFIQWGIVVLMAMLFLLMFVCLYFMFSKINRPIQVQLIGDVITHQDGRIDHAAAVEIVKQAAEVPTPPTPPRPPLKEQMAGILFANGKSMTVKEIATQLNMKENIIKMHLGKEKKLFIKADDGSDEWGLVKWMKGELKVEQPASKS
jgi:hypothetical protein